MASREPGTTIVSIFVFSILIQSLTSNKDIQWLRYLELGEGSIGLYWTPEPDNVTFEVQVKLNGSECNIGFGFSNSTVVRNVYVAWIEPNGKIKFEDRYAVGTFKFVLNEKKNYDLLTSYSNGTHLILRFRRKLNTCNGDDYTITNDTARLLYWWGYRNPVFENDVLIRNENEQIFKQSVHLLERHLATITDTSNLFIWDLHMRNVTVPAKETTYWCSVFKFPSFENKHHFIGFDALIQPGNKMVVHHYLIFECQIEKNFAEKLLQKTGMECDSFEVTLIRPNCKPALVTWTLGSRGNVYPPDIGFPMDPTANRSTFFLFEIHYNNPQIRKDIIDHSGVRLYFTSKLRLNEAGVTQFGANKGYGMVIPPGQPSFRYVSVCPSECLNTTLPANGIHIFSVGIHSHLIGTKAIVRHFRNGTELDPIVIDRAYDFTYQEIHHLPARVHVLPTDILVSECFYDSTQRNYSTISDLPATHEMCLIYPFYYPPSELEVCYSSVPTNIMDRTFNISSNLWDIFTKKSEIYIKNFDWKSADPSLSRKLQELQEYGTEEILCVPIAYKHQNEEKTFTTDFAKTLKPYNDVSAATNCDRS